MKMKLAFGDCEKEMNFHLPIQMNKRKFEAREKGKGKREVYSAVLMYLLQDGTPELEAPDPKPNYSYVGAQELPRLAESQSYEEAHQMVRMW